METLCFYESSKIQCDTKFSNDNLNNLIDELNHLFVINKDTIDTTKKFYHDMELNLS